MVQVLTRERLGIVKHDGAGAAPRSLAHWQDLRPQAAAEVVRRDVVGSGECLPAVWFSNCLLVPVVSWDLEVLETRLATNRGPVLYRSMLADRLEHGRDHLEPAVLRMEAFISLGRLPSARGALAAGSVYAPAIAAVPSPPGTDGWNAFECDFYGFTVAEVDATGARVVVEGLRRARHSAGGIGHQRRLLEEQLFDVALRSSAVPPA